MGKCLGSAAACRDWQSPLATKWIAVEFAREGVEHLLAGMTVDAIRGFLAAGFRYQVAESPVTTRRDPTKRVPTSPSAD